MALLSGVRLATIGSDRLNRAVRERDAGRVIRVALIPGDGIGPEVLLEACRVLEAAAAAGLLSVEFEGFPHGAAHYLATGETLGEDTFARLRDDFDAILLGAVGDERVPDGVHARDILLGLRFGLDLFVNLRPVRLRAPDLTPLRLRDDETIDTIAASFGRVTGVEVVENAPRLNIGELGVPFDAVFAVRETEPSS